MDVPMRRVIGSLALLLGITFLAIGLHTGQIDTVIQTVGRILESAVAGAP